MDCVHEIIRLPPANQVSGDSRHQVVDECVKVKPPPADQASSGGYQVGESESKLNRKPPKTNRLGGGDQVKIKPPTVKQVTVGCLEYVGAGVVGIKKNKMEMKITASKGDSAKLKGTLNLTPQKIILRGGGSKKKLKSLEKTTKSVNTIIQMFENVQGAKGERSIKTKKIENLKKLFEDNSELQRTSVLKKGGGKGGKKVTDKKITAYFQPKTSPPKNAHQLEVSFSPAKRPVDMCVEEINKISKTTVRQYPSFSL